MYTFPSVNLTSLVIGGAAPAVDRPVTIAQGANAAGTRLTRGTLLGEVTSTGAFITSVAAATDGSAEPRAVLAFDVDASIAAVTAPAYFSGSFADTAMTFGAGHTADTANAVFAQNGTEIFISKVGSFSTDVD